MLKSEITLDNIYEIKDINIIHTYCLAFGKPIIINDMFEPDLYKETYYIPHLKVTVYFTKYNTFKIEAF